ncbi:ABC transporter ATP-binding protein [Ornithinimicrobium pratense]|uniref:ATP-binding cassette domain-containing protein n=1 Tax=Ornithinimicrobium pratense TaxID=2593973 RepID=A0A5J6V3E4_9MICO|nr:ATP-binding cassette domain-containing protein [Ornithinimicrobium pratense]QFG67806.1 ATP-binding cassette domain-containing protein [Ornithinimicrobium pratense]
MSRAGTEHRPREGRDVSVRGLTKTFGSLRAVDDLTFDVRPGRITGFLGPNGAGKTTTLRMLLGLVRPTSGEALIGGERYVDLQHPIRTVGAGLEATGFHPGRSGRNHLRALAATGDIPDSRVDELLELVGIPAAARKRAGGYSMGMRQRLGLAGALLGDPQVLLLDEPSNGLDPEGIRWMRGFLRHLSADQGKTVLISSHLLAEVEQTVQDVVIIANGTMVRSGTMDELHGEPAALVRAADPQRLAAALDRAGIPARPLPEKGEGALEAASGDLAAIGRVALQAQVALSELSPRRTDLERLFLELTDSPQHRNRNLGDTPVTTEGDNR